MFHDGTGKVFHSFVPSHVGFLFFQQDESHRVMTSYCWKGLWRASGTWCPVRSKEGFKALAVALWNCVPCPGDACFWRVPQFSQTLKDAGSQPQLYAWRTKPSGEPVGLGVSHTTVSGHLSEGGLLLGELWDPCFTVSSISLALFQAGPLRIWRAHSEFPKPPPDIILCHGERIARFGKQPTHQDAHLNLHFTYARNNV